MADFETVEVRRRNGVATVVLNRPDSLNSWDAQLSDDLLGAFDQVAYDEEVRAVAVTGAGRAFCSGADLRTTSATAAPDGRPDLHRSLHSKYHPVINAVRALEKPVVAAVNGPAVGVGLSLALAADLVVCRRSAYFLLAFVNIGLVPDGGASAFVASRIGFARASEMAMLGERVTAEQALAWGLVNRVWDDEEFEAQADALLDRLAAGPTRSYAGVKRQLAAWSLAGLQEQLDVEARLQQEMARTDDFAEGVTAFLGKRQAAFRGR